MARLLSMDTSTTSTGCAIYDDGVLTSSFLIEADGKSENRIQKMICNIYEKIKTLSPDIIAIETPSIARNQQTQRLLCYLVGAILGCCVENDVFFHQYRPSEWRNRIKKENEKLPRKRAELKEWAVNTVNERYGIDVQDDVAEAILIGEAYIKDFI